MILIVDGDAADAASLERILRYNALESVAVTGGMEALALLDLQRPELIILELGLKDFPGTTLLRSIRTDPDFSAVPILIFTREFADEMRKEALREGAQEYLVKGTLGWVALLERIRGLLANSQKSGLE
ncbi:MAG TPA: response regulator [Phycisphaerae bacterium]|nr:response regulator [Phycisphaerae bacterium]